MRSSLGLIFLVVFVLHLILLGIGTIWKPQSPPPPKHRSKVVVQTISLKPASSMIKPFSVELPPLIHPEQIKPEPIPFDPLLEIKEKAATLEELTAKEEIPPPLIEKSVQKEELAMISPAEAAPLPVASLPIEKQEIVKIPPVQEISPAVQEEKTITPTKIEPIKKSPKIEPVKKNTNNSTIAPKKLETKESVQKKQIEKKKEQEKLEAEKKKPNEKTEAEQKRLKEQKQSEVEKKKQKEKAETEQKRLKEKTEAEKKRKKEEAEAELKRKQERAEAEKKKQQEVAAAQETTRLKREALKENLAKMDATRGKISTAPSSVNLQNTSIPKELGSLQVDALPVNEGESLGDWGVKEANYSDEVAYLLKKSLLLPDYGGVRIKLTLNRSGKVIKVETIHSESVKNKSYIESKIPSLQFPSFGQRFQGVSQYAFVISFQNDS